MIVDYWSIRAELKQLLNQPLPGGRGFQHDRDRRIHELCKQIAESPLPDR